MASKPGSYGYVVSSAGPHMVVIFNAPNPITRRLEPLAKPLVMSAADHVLWHAEHYPNWAIPEYNPPPATLEIGERLAEILGTAISRIDDGDDRP